jgi:xanthosine utilization system XapX-like protein
MSPAPVHPGHFRRVWAIPTVLAVLTVVGLLSALLGEQLVWKAFAWALLTVPVATSCWFWWRPRRPR